MLNELKIARDYSLKCIQASEWIITFNAVNSPFAKDHFLYAFKVPREITEQAEQAFKITCPTFT